MKIDIMTLFPEVIEAVISMSIIGRARKNGCISVNCVNIRDFTFDRHRKTDDYPYGGGRGMVMMAEPLYLCHKHLSSGSHVHTVLTSPKGSPFNQEKAKDLLSKEHIIIICGHYEGVDERFIAKCVDEEISLGDFVLTGGEIPALAITDAVCRMAPSVLSDEECYKEESHWNGLLEYPHYTRPEEWRGQKVPEVLLSGHHANIAKWRRLKSLSKTFSNRPDLLKKAELNDDDLSILKSLKDNPDSFY